MYAPALVTDAMQTQEMLKLVEDGQDNIADVTRWLEWMLDFVRHTQQSQSSVPSINQDVAPCELSVISRGVEHSNEPLR